jgi:hypothetical protein
MMYRNNMLRTQGKGSTAWAASLHTPTPVVEWTEFGDLIATEGTKNEKLAVPTTGISAALELLTDFVVDVTKEEHVTSNTALVLQQFRKIVTCVNVNRTDKYTAANPDLICQLKVSSSQMRGSAEQYASPPSKGKTARAKSFLQEQRDAVLFTFKTKPFWKYQFLMDQGSTWVLCRDFEVPDHFTSRDLLDKNALPKAWSCEKKKPFHAIQQIYGQIISSRRKYGAFHIYGW